MKLISHLLRYFWISSSHTFLVSPKTTHEFPAITEAEMIDLLFDESL